MIKLNIQNDSVLKNTIILIFLVSVLVFSNQSYAKGKTVNTWYKVKMKGISQTVKAKKISLMVPGAKSKNKKIKLVLGNKTIYPNVKRDNFRLSITAFGSGSQPTAQGDTVNTNTVTNGDVTITTTTEIDGDGNSVTTTKRTSSSGTTTTTTSTDSQGNTSTETKSTNE